MNDRPSPEKAPTVTLLTKLQDFHSRLFADALAEKEESHKARLLQAHSRLGSLLFLYRFPAMVDEMRADAAAQGLRFEDGLRWGAIHVRQEMRDLGFSSGLSVQLEAFDAILGD